MLTCVAQEESDGPTKYLERKTMLNARVIVVGLLFGSIASPLLAQHCPGILESYLSGISVKREDESIKIAAEYRKSGGRDKARYQAYLVAYFEKDAGKFVTREPKERVDLERVAVLHTQLIEKNRDGGYDLAFTMSERELANTMLRHGEANSKEKMPKWPVGTYKDNFRMAIFIPFLEDSKYSVLKGLPEDRHECNYSGSLPPSYFKNFPTPSRFILTQLSGSSFTSMGFPLSKVAYPLGR